jgi:hypothetical protein
VSFVAHKKVLKQWIAEIGKEEQEDLEQSFDIENLAENLSIMALDEGKICGILISTVDKLDHSIRCDDPIELKEDFTEGILKICLNL